MADMSHVFANPIPVYGGPWDGEKFSMGTKRGIGFARSFIVSKEHLGESKTQYEYKLVYVLKDYGPKYMISDVEVWVLSAVDGEEIPNAHEIAQTAADGDYGAIREKFGQQCEEMFGPRRETDFDKPTEWKPEDDDEDG